MVNIACSYFNFGYLNVQYEITRYYLLNNII